MVDNYLLLSIQDQPFLISLSHPSVQLCDVPHSLILGDGLFQLYVLCHNYKESNTNNSRLCSLRRIGLLNIVPMLHESLIFFLICPWFKADRQFWSSTFTFCFHIQTVMLCLQSRLMLIISCRYASASPNTIFAQCGRHRMIRSSIVGTEVELWPGEGWLVIYECIELIHCASF